MNIDCNEANSKTEVENVLKRSDESIYLLTAGVEENDRSSFQNNFTIASDFMTGNGGSFTFENRRITFRNTCTLDYYLLIWFILSRTNMLLKIIFEKKWKIDFYKTIMKVTQSILNRKWNSARLAWSEFIGKKFINESKSIVYDYFGSELEGFSGSHDIQSFSFKYKCSNKTCQFGKTWNDELSTGFSIRYELTF